MVLRAKYLTQNVSNWKKRIKTAFPQTITKSSFERSLQHKITHCLEQKRQNLTHLMELLKAVDPRNLLEKGYSILFSENGASVINSVDKLEKGDFHNEIH